MPTFGLWETISILFILGVPVFLLVYLAAKALPGTIREIRLMWHSATPDDNHRDR